MNSSAPRKMLVSLADPMAADVARCGGKSAGLHKMTSAGLPVPPGFVVTTEAFESVIGEQEAFRLALSKLNECAESAALREGALAVRAAVLSCTLPESFAQDVIHAWETWTKASPVAVRSSATAEDLANASFAGQQDTFLSIETKSALLEAIRGCWASLFTERAVVYRRTNGFDDAQVSMAVVIQCMVKADAAGVLFTADPLSGQRGISVIEAVAGLGEALVSGHVTPERYRVRGRDARVLERLSAQGMAIENGQGLLEDQTLRELNALGRQAESEANSPMDIEWAVEKNEIWLLQARPITTLWPLIEGKPLPGWRVFLSFGHMQVYTAPLSRVAISTFRRMAPFRRDPRTGLSDLIRCSGERVYIDVTPALGHAVFRKLLPILLSNVSEPIAERIKVAAAREEMRDLPPDEHANLQKIFPVIFGLFGQAIRNMATNPQQVRETFFGELEALIQQLNERLAQASTLEQRLEVFDNQLSTLLVDIMALLIPRLFPALMINKLMPRLASWLDPNVDHRLLLQGLEGNITTEMDMALADLGDIARDEPLLCAALESEDPHAAIEALRAIPSCNAFFHAWDAFLARHGHRGAGEIDAGVPRWREDPRIPLRSIAGALGRPRGALRQQHRSLAERAIACKDKLIQAAREKPLGFLAAPLTAGLIDRLRTLLGAREHHKFYLILVIDRLRAVVLDAGRFLKNADALADRDDIWLLELPEIRAAIREVEQGRRPNLRLLVEERRASRDKSAHATPPSVMTSEGESIAFTGNRDIPANSLAGTSVSGGLYEGTARVVYDPAKEELAAGEVLVARFTDPGWTPLFGHAGALVMEVGGQMTHGSVIAREIGIPAVVAVEGATAKIRSGDRIRVDGERGFVTILEGAVA